MMKKFLVLVILFSVGINYAWAQPNKIGGAIDYANPGTYTVAGLVVLGAEFTDPQAIKLVSGIRQGDEIVIPGEKISDAIRNLWKQKLFSQIEISAAEIRGEDIYLVISVTEMPRLSSVRFVDEQTKKKIRNADQESLKESLNVYPGEKVTEDLKNNAQRVIKEFYVDKGFLNVESRVVSETDTMMTNSSKLTIYIDKKERVKINEINFIGATAIPHKKLKRQLKDTKEKRWWRVFKSSKYIRTEYDQGKQMLIAKYNEEGYRNAVIKMDTIYDINSKLINLDITISEGNKFYYRDITFAGNTKYRSSLLDSVLNIEKGDVYNLADLDARLNMNPKGLDIASMYSDNGYLNFYLIPIETLVEPDSIDVEVRLFEGKVYKYGTITVTGNTKTNDRVVYRELRTLPGEVFSRNDIMRTQRELAQLGYFNPQAFGVNPVQNPEEGTVDIEFIVEEKPSDQIELSGGWGGGRVVGSLGLSFTNFSLRNLFKKGAWSPVPTGDGQRLSIRGQTNGSFFNSINFSFVEPWLGGKRPTSFSVSAYRSVQSNGAPRKVDGELNPDRRDLKITGGSIGLGRRFKRPDDFFQGFLSLSYQYFDLNDFGSFFSFSNGFSNNLALTGTLQRNSIDQPIFPTKGSDIKLVVKGTLPYSKIFNGQKPFEGMDDQERFDWVEYYKTKFTVTWHTSLWNHKVGEEGTRHDLVLSTTAGLGFLGSYNDGIGLSPFERFYLGGVYLSGFTLDGREIINLRGYNDLSLTNPNQNTGAPLISKYNIELKYPLSTNPNAYIYTLAFLEAGQTWGSFKDYDPFNLQRSGGIGLRIFLPMFGMLGLDYGWRFDDVEGNPNMPRGQFHFSIGTNLGDL